jgi:hypothetical protein
MPVLPFGEWLPDQPDFANPGASVITNVIPRTKQSYGPMPVAAPYSNALTAFCQGAYALSDATGTQAYVFAGDANRLYLMTMNATFADVSKAAGGPYTVPPPISVGGGFWWMTSYGERVIATNSFDPIQSFLVGTDSAFSDLSTAAPQAKFAAVIRDFLMLGRTTDGSGDHPRRLRWSAIGDPTSFPDVGSNDAIEVQSDEQDLEQSDLGVMTGLIGGHLSAADGAAWMERGIYRIMYVGSPAIFDFVVAEGSPGTQAPMSIVQRRLSTQAGTSGVAFFLGEEDFYAFDGMSSVPIGAQKIARTFFNDASPTYLPQVVGTADPVNPLIFWAYNSGSSAGLYDRLLVYNWQLQRWSLVDLSATPIEWITRTITTSITLDALDARTDVLDNLTPGLDSRVWAGGAPILSLFDQSHQLNYLSNTNMAPIVETSETQHFPGRRARIISARPLVDGAGGSVAVGHREQLTQPVTYEAAIPNNIIGECPQRVTGRYTRYRFTLPAATAFNHLQGIDLSAQPEATLR